MAEAKKEIDYSLQNAMDKLAQITSIISQDKKKIFMKKPEEVDEELLLKLSRSLLGCATLFNELMDIWSGSKTKGIDAFQKTDKLDERIDIKLYNTGKLDFEQMKRIMARLNRIDDALQMEEVTKPYLMQFKYLCEEKKVFRAFNFANEFQTNFIDVFTKHLLNEKNRLENQVERCNLYYQAKLNTRTVTIAWVALGVSVLSILATIVLAIFK
jgi:hypothetical protein